MLKHIQHAVRLVRHALRPGKRSAHWPKVEHEFLSEHPACAACAGTVRLNVHHKHPFHLDPALELDKNNLITLCMEIGKHCHLLIGHGDNFRAYDPDVAKDAAEALELRRTHDTTNLTRLEERVKRQRKLV